MSDEKQQQYQITTRQRLHLKAFLKSLREKKGRGTMFVSVYVPSGYDLNKINTHLQQEQSTATNIKSKLTRDNVIFALEKMIQHLKLFKKNPPNGLAIFSGNVAEREGQQDVQVWSTEPPIPLNQRLYRCDKEFVLEPLEEMAVDQNFFGMIVLDKREGIVAMLKGKTIVPLSKATSAVPGKHKTGGQSAARMERLRDEAAKEFYKKIADMTKKEFLGKQELRGILVGGPGHSKNEFLEQGQLTQELKDKVITTQDLSYTMEFGLQELLEKCEDVLSNEDVIGEKKLMEKFFNKLSREPDQVTYGQGDVMRCLQMGAVDVALVSETVDEAVVEEFEKEAQNVGSTVEVISTETREGVQLKEMGSFAAILRYAVNH